MSQINLEPIASVGDEDLEVTLPGTSLKAAMYRARTGPDGVADFDSIAPGRYLCHVGHDYFIPKSNRPFQQVEIGDDRGRTDVQLCEVYGVAFRVTDDEIIHYSIVDPPASEFFQSQITYRAEFEERLGRKWPDHAVVAWIPSDPGNMRPSTATVMLRDGGERNLRVSFAPVRTLQPTVFDREPGHGGAGSGYLTINVQSAAKEAIGGLEFEVRPTKAPRIIHAAVSGAKKLLPAGTYRIRPQWGLPVVPEPGREVVIEPGQHAEVQLEYDREMRRCRLEIDCGARMALDRVAATVSMEGVEDRRFWSSPPFDCLLPLGKARVTVWLFGIPEVVSEFTVRPGRDLSDVQVIPIRVYL
jgi:hypothetical protein